MSLHKCLLLPLLAAILLINISPTDSALCGTITDCNTGTGADCIDDICFCHANFMGPDCKADCTAATCVHPQVCTGDISGNCAACNPVCQAVGGTCATVDTAPKCKCESDFSGDDCGTFTCSSATAPCQNGGTCASGVCACPETHAGLVCELACATCAAGQKCVDEGGSPVCQTKCGTGTCVTAKGDCVADVCYCKPLFMGANCGTACAACTTAGQVCDADATCAACNPVCDATGGNCSTVGTTPTCKCNTGYTGTTCADSGVTTVLPSVLIVALLVLLRLL